MSQVITRGEVFHRTKTMELGRAARFARCLVQNRRFQSVTVEESKRTKGQTRWYVRFQPSNGERLAEMIGSQESSRFARGLTQPFVFVADPDSQQPFAWCHSVASGETYEVTAFDCTCPDYRYRLAGSGVRCKHMVALSAATERGELAPMPAPRPNPYAEHYRQSEGG